MSNKDIKLVQLPSPNFVPERDVNKPLMPHGNIGPYRSERSGQDHGV